MMRADLDAVAAEGFSEQERGQDPVGGHLLNPVSMGTVGPRDSPRPVSIRSYFEEDSDGYWWLCRCGESDGPFVSEGCPRRVS